MSEDMRIHGFLPVALDTIARGSAAEMFQAEFERVAENIVDPNCDKTAKRSITLKFEFTPNGADDNGVAVLVTATSKLAAFRGGAGSILVGRHSDGHAVAHAYMAQQTPLFDSETGEVIKDAAKAAGE